MEAQLSLQQEPSVGHLLQGALSTIQNGQITTQHVEVLGRLMDLYERNDKRQSEKDFAEALTSLQGETIRVKATKAVDQKSDGTCRYRFAPYEEIMEQVQPMLTRYGFSISFNTDITPDGSRLTSECILTHKSGHTRSNKFAVRFGKPPGSSEAQGDMSTKSYAKRGALCDALNIVIDHDTDGSDDARTIGAPITQQQADELRELCDDTKADRKKLLEYADAATFEEITTSRYEDVKATLLRRKK